jgi:hypothetical protein
VSDDAIYRDEDGTEYVVEWVTQDGNRGILCADVSAAARGGSGDRSDADAGRQRRHPPLA